MPDTPPSNSPEFFAELFDSVEGDFDAQSGSSRRRFRCGQLVVQNATINPPAGFPTFGQEHPRYQGLFCDRVGVEGRLDQFSTVMYALYSSDGRFKLVANRPPNDTTRGFLSMVPERADLTIPFFVASPVKVPKYKEIDVGLPETVTQVDGIGTGYEWQRYDIKTVRNRTIISRTVTLTSLDGATLKRINAQTDQIHSIPNGEKWQMIAPTVRQTAISLWNVDYQWRRETTIPVPGTPLPPTDPTIPSLVLAAYYRTATDPLEPFWAYKVIPGAFTITLSDGIFCLVPSVVVFDKFPTLRDNIDNPSGLGWALLPGNPLAEYV